MATKVKTATLLDRITTQDGTLIIRAQDRRTGACFDVEVQDAAAKEAGRIYGGGLVRYLRAYGNKRAQFLTSASADAIQEQEYEDKYYWSDY